MHDICTYRIEIQGHLDTESFNTMSPYTIMGVHAGTESTLFTICADQSGLVGIIRHLHQQGFVLLSICRQA